MRPGSALIVGACIVVLLVSGLLVVAGQTLGYTRAKGDVWFLAMVVFVVGLALFTALAIA